MCTTAFHSITELHVHVHYHLTMSIGLVHYCPVLAEAQDVIAHTGGPPTLHLMLVSKELLSSTAPTVVHLPMSENPQQSTLACINITNNGNPEGGREGGRVIHDGIRGIRLCHTELLKVLKKIGTQLGFEPRT